MNRPIRFLLTTAVLFSNQFLVSAMFRSMEEGSLDYSLDQTQFEKLNDVIGKSRALVESSGILESLDICGGFQLIADQLPSGGSSSCICQDNAVQCTLQGQCNGDQSICTDVIALSFEFIAQNVRVNNMKLSACFSYTTDFETTCIETTISRGQLLETCNAATYGGNECLCAVCDDQKSLILDCSMHDDRASSNGCYLLSDAVPALKQFDEPPRTNAQPRRTSTTTQMLSEEPQQAGGVDTSQAATGQFFTWSFSLSLVATCYGIVSSVF